MLRIDKVAAPLLQLIDSVYSADQLPEIVDERKVKTNPLNANYHKKAFKELWSQIHQKAVYSVQFETSELVSKCVAALDAELKVAPLQYVIERGEQRNEASFEDLQAGAAFDRAQTETQTLKASVHSAVKYDLIGKLAEETKLTRATMGTILKQIKPSVFGFYRVNPEDFLRVAARLVNEQKATVIVEHLTYSATDETYGIDIFAEKPRKDFSSAVKTNRKRDFLAVLTKSGFRVG
jgi:type III restriction enzyme